MNSGSMHFTVPLGIQSGNLLQWLIASGTRAIKSVNKASNQIISYVREDKTDDWLAGFCSSILLMPYWKKISSIIPGCRQLGSTMCASVELVEMTYTIRTEQQGLAMLQQWLYVSFTEFTLLSFAPQHLAISPPTKSNTIARITDSIPVSHYDFWNIW